MEKVTIGLGETWAVNLSDAGPDAAAKAKGKKGRWGTSNSHAVLNSEDLTATSVDVVGASIGLTRVFYQLDADYSDSDLRAIQALGPQHRAEIDQKNVIAFDVEVVVKDDKGKTLQPAPLTGTQHAEGLLPVNETQEGPSEKTPYGMDQDNKPVAPWSGMVSPDKSNMAKQSEEAKPEAPAAPGQPTPVVDETTTKPETKSDKK